MVRDASAFLALLLLAWTGAFCLFEEVIDLEGIERDVASQISAPIPSMTLGDILSAPVQPPPATYFHTLALSDYDPPDGTMGITHFVESGGGPACCPGCQLELSFPSPSLNPGESWSKDHGMRFFPLPCLGCGYRLGLGRLEGGAWGVWRWSPGWELPGEAKLANGHWARVR